MPVVEVATGAQLDYEDTGGAGEVVVAVHGMLGTGRYHLGAVIDWLHAEFGWRVIAPTLRGYGESLPKPRDFPLDFYHRDARDVLALMDALAIDRAHVMGYSDGGEIALILGGTQPERFRSVVTWGAVGYFGPAMRPVAQRMYPATWIEPAELALHHMDNPDGFALGWINAVKHMIDAGGDVSLSLASKIEAPILLLLGDEDHLNPEEYGRNFINQTKRGRLQMFPCGHAVHDLEWGAFRQVVGDFYRAL